MGAQNVHRLFHAAADTTFRQNEGTEEPRSPFNRRCQSFDSWQSHSLIILSLRRMLMPFFSRSPSLRPSTTTRPFLSFGDDA